MGLKYIYTGYHKCGTKTIAQAFRILGFKVYDFEENVVHLIHYWKKFFSKKLSTEDRYQLLYNMYKDVDVAVEGPNLYFWRELLEVFPEAKVIHYSRPIDSWYKSYVKQNKEIRQNYKYLPNFFIEGSILFVPTFRAQKVVQKQLSCMMAGEPAGTWLAPWTSPEDSQNEIGMKRAYRLHNNDVLMSCPKNRLLVLESLDISWDIICEFTNTKIPKEPWPHENKNGLGLIESRGWSAYDFYMPFSKPRSIYMAKIKREAEVTFLSLIFVIMVFGYVYKYVEFDFSFLYDFD